MTAEAKQREDDLVRVVKRSQERTVGLWERAREILDSFGSMEEQFEDYPEDRPNDGSTIRDGDRGAP